MLERFDSRAEDERSAGTLASHGTGDPRMRALVAALAGGDRDLGARIVTEAMAANDLASVPALASEFASQTRIAVGADGSVRSPYPHGLSPGLSAAKARHDLRQLEWLTRSGEMPSEADAAITLLRRALGAFDDLAADVRLPWDSDAGRLALSAAERVQRVRRSPRLGRALSSSWNRAAAAEEFSSSHVGLVIVDDFLTAEALTELRRFCLESTIWVGNRYPNGRLSSLLLNGFASPLLFQIADELREALPAVIGTHPLRQLWGFKYTESLPAGSTVHADSAAINVNFWITPEAANRYPGSGGMTIYELGAPGQWSFGTYNRDIEAIRRLLALRQPRAIHVPYRCNRAIIFNSDLFHETDSVDFDDAYQHHRINVTMLYGDRAGEPVLKPSSTATAHAWRSGAFRRQ
jgi:hypothetical protein